MLFWSRFFFVLIAVTLSFKDIAHAGLTEVDLPDEIWTHIAKQLKNKKDLGSLSLVSKRLSEVTSHSSAWEGVASEYDIKPTQVRRFFEILSEHKGQARVADIHIFVGFSKLPCDYVSQYRRERESPITYPDAIPVFFTLPRHYLILPSYYFEVKDYAKLKVENEDKEAEEYREAFKQITLKLEPIKLEPIKFELIKFETQSNLSCVRDDKIKKCLEEFKQFEQIEFKLPELQPIKFEDLVFLKSDTQPSVAE